MISFCVDSESQITTCDCNPWIHGRLRCSTCNIVHLSLIIEDEGPQTWRVVSYIYIYPKKPLFESSGPLERDFRKTAGESKGQNPLLEGAVHENVNDGVVAEAVFLS